MNGSRMPQIMNSRLVTRTIGAADASAVAEHPESVLKRDLYDAASVACHEKRAFAMRRRASFAVVLQCLMQLRPEWNQSGFAKLALNHLHG